MNAERRRLPLALLLSVLMHALLLSLTFGGERFGLPGFAFPWRERRVAAPDLLVELVPAKVTTAAPADTPVMEPQQQASIKQIVAGGLTRTPPVFSAPILPQAAEPIMLKAEANATPPKQAEPAPEAAPTPIPAPVVIAVERSDDATWAVPPPPPVPAPVIAVAPSAPITPSPETVTPTPRDVGEVVQKRAEPEVRERVVEVAKPDPPEREAERQRQADQLEAARVEAVQLQAARQEAARVEVLRLEAARLETQRQEAARLAAAQVEAQHQEVARQAVARVEATRLEAARLEAQRQETTRLAAAQAEAQRQEVARQAARVEAARQAAARLEAERQEAVRQAAAQKETARIQEEKEEDARRDARRQAMGRVLNEEAAQRAAAETAARSPSTLPFSYSTPRRARLWGRSDPNVELVQYAEAWALKIQFNTPVNTVREMAKRPPTDAMVTVAIRSDGYVESVTFVRSSGVAEVDEAIRRIVQSQPHQAFPPGLASEFDVIEVRRSWHFDTAVRLY